MREQFQELIIVQTVQSPCDIHYENANFKIVGEEVIKQPQIAYIQIKSNKNIN